MKALLTSTCLRRISSIGDSDNQGSWQSDVTVVGWRLRTNDTPLLMGDSYEQEDNEYVKSPADIITTYTRT